MEASGPEWVAAAATRAVEALNSELSVVFGDASRVERACEALRHAVETGLPWPVDRPTSLIDLALARSTPANRAFLRFLLDWMPEAFQPWDILRRLIASADPETERAACQRLVGLVEAGRLELHDDVLEGVAAAAVQPSSPLTASEARRVFRTALGIDEGQPGETVRRLLIPRADGTVARFVADLLDESGRPSDRLVEELLGPRDWEALRPCWHYTQGRHADLVALLCGRPHDIAEAVTNQRESRSGLDVRECIAALGWARCNLALRFAHLTGFSVNGSMPFMLRDAESSLFSDRDDARLAYERTVVVSVGAAGSAQAVDVSVPGTRATTDLDRVARFRAYNLLHAQILGQLLDLTPLTVTAVEGMLDTMARIVAEFSHLFARKTGECVELDSVHTQLTNDIRRALVDSVPGRPLSPSVTRLVQMFEDPKSLSDVRTLHGLKRYLHQRGLALGFTLLEGQGGTNRSVDVVVVENGGARAPVRRIQYVDFEQSESAVPPLPDGVTLLVDEFVRVLANAPAIELPAVKVFCYGNEVHYYLLFGNHPVFARVDLSPPLAGGMVDVEYYGVSKYELDGHPDLDLHAIQAFFERLEYDVQITQTRIHARYDKERAVSLGDICDKARALFRLIPYLMDLDWMIGRLDVSPNARRLLIDAWSEVFEQWGVLPVGAVLSQDGRAIVCQRERQLERDSESIWDGSMPYRDVFTGRPGPQVADDLWRVCRASGLPVDVEHHDVATQLGLERHLLLPLRDALARGEVIVEDGRLQPAGATRFRRSSEAVAFADLLHGPDDTLVNASELAGLVRAIERTLRFEAAGSVDGFPVQRAWLPLRFGGLGVFVLRDSSDVARLAFYCHDRTLAERRSHENVPWESNLCVDVERFLGFLRRNNFLSVWLERARAACETARDVRAYFAFGLDDEPDGEDEDAIRGTTIAPGRVTGLACIGTNGRQPADVAGRVLIAPTLGADDNAFLYQSAGLVCTGGAGLSHAGLLANQFGRPGLIVTGVIESGDANRYLSFTRFECTRSRSVAFGRRIVERSLARTSVGTISDGDVVELDADARVLRVLGHDRATLRFHRTWRQLLGAHRHRVEARDDSEILTWRGAELRARRQLEQLCVALRDQRLACFIVRELVSAAVQEGCESEAVNEAAALFDVLLANQAVGMSVSAHLLERIDRMQQHVAAVEAAALSEMRSAEQPDEILAFRSIARRAADALSVVEAFSQPRSVAQAKGEAPPAALEDDALSALKDHWSRALGEVRASGPDERHLIGQLHRLRTILPVSTLEDRDVEERAATLRAADVERLGHLQGRLVLGENEGGIELAPLVGSKAANLGEVARCGMASLVPRWFVVTDAALRAALGSIGPAIDRVLATPLSDGRKALEIRALWEGATLPAALVDDIVQGYRRLGDTECADDYVAIRSSACEEDTETATRAGEFDTFLFVRGREAVVDYVKRVWAGFWSARAIHNRRIYALAASHASGGVVVQRMISARVAGVLQTIDVPRSRYRDMVIDVGLGLGEGVVSGRIGTDHIVVEKKSIDEDALRFRYVTGDKRQRLVFAEGPPPGLLLEKTAAHQRLRSALEYIELYELVHAARALERWYRYPLDIEFAFDGCDLRILQVRPVPGMLNVWWETRDRFPFERECAG
ncbi:MAG: PEP/pyruvate-binding domain-containing protein [Vicinamibacterales bacterium]